jgi:phosphoserine phosphatase RsbU/P
MNATLISSAVVRFFRLQQLYVVIAVAVYGIFWAIGQPSGIAVTLIYSLCVGNFASLLINRLSISPEKPNGWMFNAIVLLAFAPIIVFLSTAIVFWTDLRPGGGQFLFPPSVKMFWSYLHSGWKFPFVATLIFGSAAQLHRHTRGLLEKRNLELQKAVEIEATQRELQDQELERAREIQQSLLPKQLPQLSGVEIAASWEPARIVGGDYFDVIKLSENKVAICIADVVGKSVSAALLMANVQAAVRAFASEAVPPSWLCSRVNSVLCNNIATGKFVTLFYGVLDTERQIFEYTNAGHLRPILMSRSGEVRELENDGALLGVFPTWTYEDSTVQLVREIA